MSEKSVEQNMNGALRARMIAALVSVYRPSHDPNDGYDGQHYMCWDERPQGMVLTFGEVADVIAAALAGSPSTTPDETATTPNDTGTSAG